MRYRVSTAAALMLFSWASLARSADTAPPAVGDKAPEFTLRSVAGTEVRLSELVAQGPVALVVLRGYPGYQ